MLIAANIGVVDEVDLIERQIAHLRRIGVDRIIVSDTGSVDGTREILRAAAGAGEVTLIEVSPDDPDPFDYANRMLALTRQRYSPDWIVFGDADEFLLPRGGSLRDVLASQTAEVLRVTRLNIALGPDGPLWPRVPGLRDLEETWLVTRPIPAFEAHLRTQPHTPWILGQVMPKVVARGRAATRLAMGAHALGDGDATPPADSDDLLIAHVAFSDEARFLRKLANIRRVLTLFPERFPGSAGWHWKRWMALAESGHAVEEFRRQVMGEAEIAAHRDAGSIASAADWFAARGRG